MYPLAVWRIGHVFIWDPSGWKLVCTFVRPSRGLLHPIRPGNHREACRLACLACLPACLPLGFHDFSGLGGKTRNKPPRTAGRVKDASIIRAASTRMGRWRIITARLVKAWYRAKEAASPSFVGVRNATHGGPVRSVKRLRLLNRRPRPVRQRSEGFCASRGADTETGEARPGADRCSSAYMIAPLYHRRFSTLVR